MKPRISSFDRLAVLAIASRLLQYPDDELVGCLDQMDTLASRLPGELRRPLARVIGHYKAISLLRLQAEYVETFDLRGRNCLYLTYLRTGDTRDRGMALWQFGELYRSRGFSVIGGELPDYLPAMLELAAAAPEGDQAPLEVLTGHRAELALLRESLKAAESPYAGVVRAVEAVLPKPDRDVAETMRRLREAGPPQEQVGLEPVFVHEAEPVEAGR